MIAIIDYGMGNLRSVNKGFEKMGYNSTVTKSKREIKKAKGVVLPGVGSFKDCMNNLIKLKLVDTVYEIIDDNKPFLGICLGLQILFTESEEFGSTKGLDIIKGKVVRFPDNIGLKIPHMGWNSINIRKNSPILEGIEDGSYFYFVHSYYGIPDKENDVTLSTTEYGVEFASSICKNNIFAFQFHPEKSQGLGLRILKNFGDLCR
jgi:glutamine amidotransferase